MVQSKKLRWKVLVVGGLSLLVVLATTAAGAAKKPTIGEELAGTGKQIIVAEPFTPMNVIYEDETCWIRGGFGFIKGSGLQPYLKEILNAQDSVMAGRVTYRLFIDGEEIKLDTRRNVFPGWDGQNGVRGEHWSFYIVFEPYHFEPGVYELMGLYDLKNPNTKATSASLGAVFPEVRTTTLTVLER